MPVLIQTLRFDALTAFSIALRLDGMTDCQDQPDFALPFGRARYSRALPLRALITLPIGVRSRFGRLETQQDTNPACAFW
jgi:hypothetical protein